VETQHVEILNITKIVEKRDIRSIRATLLGTENKKSSYLEREKTQKKKRPRKTK